MQCLHFTANWSDTTAELQVLTGKHLDTLLNLDEVDILKNSLVLNSLRFFGIDSLEGTTLSIPYYHINDLERLVASLEDILLKLEETKGEKVVVGRSIIKDGIDGALYLKSFSLTDNNLDKIGRASFMKSESSYKIDPAFSYKNKRPEKKQYR